MTESPNTKKGSAAKVGPRFWIVGLSGSGKSTLGKSLAQIYSINSVELDSIFHQANWQPMEDAEFHKRVNDLVAQDAWVIDGNYSTVAELLKSRSTTVIFLDLPLRKIIPRIFKRSLKRVINREELWNGNRESLASIFSPRPQRNVMLWALLQYRKRRRLYLSPEFLKGHSHTNLVVLHNQKEIDRYLNFLRNGV